MRQFLEMVAFADSGRMTDKAITIFTPHPFRDVQIILCTYQTPAEAIFRLKAIKLARIDHFRSCWASTLTAAASALTASTFTQASAVAVPSSKGTLHCPHVVLFPGIDRY